MAVIGSVSKRLTNGRFVDLHISHAILVIAVQCFRVVLFDSIVHICSEIVLLSKLDIFGFGLCE